ncbi:MAG: HAMP domain-containing sensor histidine kinase [Bacteroidota bacterium]
MFRLVPTWIENYDEFWAAIKRRNLFFIKLRYVAVLMLFLFLFILDDAIGLKFSDTQSLYILLIALFLFIYNFLIHFARKFLKNIPKTFNPLHLSLLQIIVDFFVLTILIYLTGGIESPLNLFYIFHIIIGSLILPGYVIYIITTLAFSALTIISFFEYTSYIPHYALSGLFETSLYDNSAYIFMRLIVLGLMMFISAFLTIRIAHQLYIQEEQLMDALEEINKSEIKKQKYIMGVVHEIKSPIAATKSILTLIVDGFVGEVAQPIKEKLNRAIFRTTESLGLINNILRISRLRLIDEKTSEVVDIQIIVNELLEENKERLSEKSIDVVKESVGVRQRNIMGDKFLIQLAISNVISNAVKYTDYNGKIWIKIEYALDFLELSVCDDGIGIAKSELSKIFDNYYRAKNIDSEYHEGSGVGLSLVREIIVQHRGEITANSPSHLGTTDKPGTCFSIKLPYSFEEIDKQRTEPSPVKGGV